MSEPQYKMVDGELVELTPEEIEQNETDQMRSLAQEGISQPKFDFGQTMAEILGTAPGTT
jgi:hypothetical protein